MERRALRTSTTAPVPLGDKPIERDAQKQLFAALRTHDRSKDDLKYFLKAQWGYTSTKSIQQSQFHVVIDWIRAPFDPQPPSEK